MKFYGGQVCRPLICLAIAWREPQRFLDMALALLSATGKGLTDPNKRVRIRKVGVKCQRLFGCGNALGHPVCEDLHVTQYEMGKCMIGRQRQAFSRGWLCCGLALHP